MARTAPGTFGLCAAIKHGFDVDPVPHVLCNGFTREETEDALIELNYLGIENVLAIRGDGEARPPTDGRTVNESGLDLVRQVGACRRVTSAMASPSLGEDGLTAATDHQVTGGRSGSSRA